MTSDKIFLALPTHIFQRIAYDASANGCDIYQQIAHDLHEFLENRKRDDEFLNDERKRLKKVQSDFISGKWSL